MFRRAVACLGMCCSACGGEARSAEAPPPRQQPIAASSSESSEPVALVAPPPSPSTEDAGAEIPLASILGEPKPWDATKCRGSDLDFEALRRTYECRVDRRSEEPQPQALKLVQPGPSSIPRGNHSRARVDLVNSGADAVTFTVTVGESLPSVEFRDLQRGGKKLPVSCLVSMLTTGVTLRIELEPGGKLRFSAPLYANDSLSDRYRRDDEYGMLGSSSDCDAKPLPRGNGYSVEARIDVNAGNLSGRLAFSVD